MAVAELDNLDIAIYADIDELVAVTVAEVIDQIEDGISRNGEFHLVLTGGTLGVALGVAIANELNDGDFAGLHIWWSDERFVDLNSKERNDLDFVNSLNNKKVVVHRAPSNGSIESLAESFSKELENVQLDLVIIGVGPDGHVASLFPNEIYQNEKRKAFAITNSPKPPAERITFSLNVINSADEIWVVASGDSKRDAIEGFMDGDMNLPVSHLIATRLLVDSAAFGVDE